MPLPGSRPLRLSAQPGRPVPVYLAAVGPRATELAGEIADGWLAAFFSPEHSARRLAALRESRAAAGQQNPFEVVTTVPLSVADDLAEAGEPPA